MLPVSSSGTTKEGLLRWSTHNHPSPEIVAKSRLVEKISPLTHSALLAIAAIWQASTLLGEKLKNEIWGIQNAKCAVDAPGILFANSLCNLHFSFITFQFPPQNFGASLRSLLLDGLVPRLIVRAALTCSALPAG